MLCIVHAQRLTVNVIKAEDDWRDVKVLHVSVHASQLPTFLVVFHFVRCYCAAAEQRHGKFMWWWSALDLWNCCLGRAVPTIPCLLLSPAVSPFISLLLSIVLQSGSNWIQTGVSGALWAHPRRIRQAVVAAFRVKICTFQHHKFTSTLCFNFVISDHLLHFKFSS